MAQRDSRGRFVKGGGYREGDASYIGSRKPRKPGRRKGRKGGKRGGGSSGVPWIGPRMESGAFSSRSKKQKRFLARSKKRAGGGGRGKGWCSICQGQHVPRHGLPPLRQRLAEFPKGFKGRGAKRIVRANNKAARR